MIDSIECRGQVKHDKEKAARIVVKTRRRDSITPVLQKLHWLPVKKRIIFKLLILTFKALNGQAPLYISELLSAYSPGHRSLRSHSCGLLQLPRKNWITQTYGSRAFIHAAPTLWNRLPDNIRKANSINSFKQLLKSHLFNLDITDWYT